MIGMDTADFAFLGLICCVVAIGLLFRERRIVRLAVVIFLACVGCGSALLLSMGPPRSLFDPDRPHTGEPREEFHQGVREATKHSQLLAPYVMISTVGLVLMAIVGQRRVRAGSEPASGGNR